MASIGIERKLDELGRVVIPKEFRNSLNIHVGTSLSISVEGSKVIIQKSSGVCSICGESKNIRTINGKNGICPSCVSTIQSGDF